MRRPTTRSRGQGRSRRPTPRPSRPVRGGPKGPPTSRPVRGGSRGRGGTGTTGPSRATQIRSGKSDVRTPRGTRATAVAPKTPPKPRTTGLKPTKKGPDLPLIKKTPPNTGTSTKTAQLAKSQRQPTAAERKQMEAALRAAQQARLDNKAPTQKVPAGAKPATPAELAKFRSKTPAAPTGSRAAAIRRRKRRGGLAGALRRAAAAKASRPTAPTGSRAAAMRRRRRSGGLAGALRRRRARMGR